MKKYHKIYKSFSPWLVKFRFCHFFVYWVILINNSSKCSFLWVLSQYINKIVLELKISLFMLSKMDYGQLFCKYPKDKAFLKFRMKFYFKASYTLGLNLCNFCSKISKLAWPSLLVLPNKDFKVELWSLEQNLHKLYL